MKIRVAYIDYDALGYALDNKEIPPGKHDEVIALVKEFALDGDILTVEFDTETRTATVLKVK